MSRVLVLIAAMAFIRKVALKAKRGSQPSMSPYKNSLDGALSAQQMSTILADMQFCLPAAGDRPARP